MLEKQSNKQSSIKAWAEASFSVFSGNVIEAFQPLDFFHFYGLWYDLWIKNFLTAAENLQAEHKSYTDLKHVLPTPSNMRAIIQKMIPAYLGTKNPKTQDFARFYNFFARMLSEACPNDPFGLTSSPLHRPEQVEKIYDTTKWQEANPALARKIGRLITSTGSLVHGLYNDVVTDFGWDAYGPYQIENFNLLIRHFPNLQPQELWSEKYLPSVKEIYIYGLFEGVKWRIACFGCHTVVDSGDPILGLKKYAVIADGQVLTPDQVDKLILEFSGKAETIYREIKKKNLEDLKIMVMRQECYQLKKLFEAGRVDWQPTEEMLARVKNKPMLANILPRGKIMTSLEEYIELFGLRRFAKEVLGEKI